MPAMLAPEARFLTEQGLHQSDVRVDAFLVHWQLHGNPSLLTTLIVVSEKYYICRQSHATI